MKDHLTKLVENRDITEVVGWFDYNRARSTE